MRALVVIPVLGLLAAAPVTASAGDASAGEARYRQMCASCHGPAGKGDGPAAAALRPRPADFTRPEWQASVDDDYLRKIIREGGPSVGKSPLMTPFGRAINDRQLEDIIAYLRSLDGK